MKVLHVGEVLKGGIATYLSEVVRYQQEVLDGDVYVLAPENQICFLDLKSDRYIVGVAYRGRTISSLFRYATRIYCLVKRIEPDVIHLHSTFAGLSGRLGVALYNCFSTTKVVVIYCPHGWSFCQETSKVRQKMYVSVEKALMALSDCIVNISYSEYNDALKHGLSPSKMVTILSGLSDPSGHSSVKSVDPTKLNILYVGRLDYQKGFDLLIEAMLLVDKHIHLHVVGDYVINKTGLGPLVKSCNVSYHGWQSKEDVKDYLYVCDALIIPSRWEGFGLVALEAMRSGRAVIASARGALPEIVESNKTGVLIPELSAKGICDVLDVLTKQNLKRYGESGRKRYLSLFTAQRMNRSIVNLYEKYHFENN